jgi:hypothetical protein
VIDHLIEQTECQDDNGACVLLLDSAKTYDNIVQDEQEIALNMDTTTTDLKSPDTNVASNSASSNLHIDRHSFCCLVGFFYNFLLVCRFL